MRKSCILRRGIAEACFLLPLLMLSFWMEGNASMNLDSSFISDTRFLERVTIAFPGDPQRDLIHSLFYGKTWRDVSFSAVKLDYEGPLMEIPLAMTDSGLCHFLPTFLNWMETQGDEIEDLPAALLLRLTRDIQGDQRVALSLTSSQKAVMVEVFDKMFVRNGSVDTRYAAVRKFLLDEKGEGS